MLFLRNQTTLIKAKDFGGIIRILLLLCLICDARGEQPVWGVNAMTLRPAYPYAPSLAEILTNSDNTISLNRFYRAGGVGMARAETECRVACDTKASSLYFVAQSPIYRFR